MVEIRGLVSWYQDIFGVSDLPDVTIKLLLEGVPVWVKLNATDKAVQIFLEGR